MLPGQFEGLVYVIRITAADRWAQEMLLRNALKLPEIAEGWHFTECMHVNGFTRVSKPPGAA